MFFFSLKSLPRRLLSVVFSFIADNSKERDRTIMLAVQGMIWDLSYTLSLPLGAWLFNSGGYTRQGWKKAEHTKNKQTNKKTRHIYE